MGSGEDQVVRDLLGLQEKIYRLFDEQTRGARDPREAVSAHWVPPVDVYDDGEAFVLVAEVPGVDREEIDLQISDGLLVLRGERPLHTADPSVGYHRVECPNGIFQRSFRLPEGIDPEGVQAVYADGVLRITVPKSASGGRRSVVVEVDTGHGSAR
ncbi:MAG: Hsp20/alpha crystallin family protein [Deferrisomatales bacterium]